MKNMRFATQQDVDKLLAFLGQAHAADERIREIYSQFMLLEDAGRIQATLGYERAGETGLLRSMILSPTVDKGMLLQLLEGFLYHVKEQGVHHMYLITMKQEALPLFHLFRFQAASPADVPAELAQIPHFQEGMKQPGAILLNCQLFTELSTDL